MPSPNISSCLLPVREYQRFEDHCPTGHCPTGHCPTGHCPTGHYPKDTSLQYTAPQDIVLQDIAINFYWLLEIFLAINSFTNLSSLSEWIDAHIQLKKIHSKQSTSKPPDCCLNLLTPACWIHEVEFAFTRHHPSKMQTCKKKLLERFH